MGWTMCTTNRPVCWSRKIPASRPAPLRGSRHPTGSKQTQHPHRTATQGQTTTTIKTDTTVAPDSTSTTTVTTTTMTVLGQGYAGHGTGIDNPAQQGISNTGPIPQGVYSIQQQQTNATNNGNDISLPSPMRLTPDPSNNILGRTGFLVHGGDMQSQNSSHECIVLPSSVRNQIDSSGDQTLRVVS